MLVLFVVHVNRCCTSFSNLSSIRLYIYIEYKMNKYKRYKCIMYTLVNVLLSNPVLCDLQAKWLCPKVALDCIRWSVLFVSHERYTVTSIHQIAHIISRVCHLISLVVVFFIFCFACVVQLRYTLFISFVHFCCCCCWICSCCCCYIFIVFVCIFSIQCFITLHLAQTKQTNRN